MNEKKICFIYCVNDEKLFEESVRYIHHLSIPDGYTVEIVKIDDADSICLGYNRAMAQTDAKYKVYLHQDVFIINENFVNDVISLFKINEKLGMLGVVGSKTIPFSGVWWESDKKAGQVFDSHTGRMKLLQYEHPQDSYESVSAIDGMIMITQYDIPWREDLFNGWHFYDLSQCQEYIKAGFDVGIPKQSSTWCIHDCGLVNTANGFEEYRRTFLNNYSADVFGELPLVSILIPTYNRPFYFEQALKSAINQTYPNIEIIIGDDSTNDETQILIEEYLKEYRYIKYIKHETNLGQFENDLFLLKLAKGDFINFLMDDDIFHPLKIEKMMEHFISNPNVSLVTSHRQLIDGNGNFLNDISSTKRLFNVTTLINGIEFGNHLLKNVSNVVGEPTTVLFRKKDLIEPFGMFQGRRYLCNVDLASWLNLLSQGDIVYISDTLSYFRIHDGQQQQSVEMYVNGILDFSHQILHSKNKGFLTIEYHYVTALENLLNYIKRIISINNVSLVIRDTKNYLEIQQILKYIEDYLDNNEIINDKREPLQNYKYDFQIDINSENNSHAQILRKVGKNKRVLELGCATGYMTNVLTNLLGCEVSCIEYDSSSAEKARKYSNNVIVGDLNNFDFNNHFKTEEFDVVIFADVLEHLYDPLDVLKRVKPFLKKTGEILVSIPNISHGSIIAELMQGRFQYRNLGLLDDTHIRFFTRSGIIKLFKEAGFIIKEMDRTFCLPEQTEFKTDFNVFPNHVGDYIKTLPDANTYQFIVRIGL